MVSWLKLFLLFAICHCQANEGNRSLPASRSVFGTTSTMVEISRAPNPTTVKEKPSAPPGPSYSRIGDGSDRIPNRISKQYVKRSTESMPLTPTRSIPPTFFPAVSIPQTPVGPVSIPAKSRTITTSNFPTQLPMALHPLSTSDKTASQLARPSCCSSPGVSTAENFLPSNQPADHLDSPSFINSGAPRPTTIMAGTTKPFTMPSALVPIDPSAPVMVSSVSLDNPLTDQPWSTILPSVSSKFVQQTNISIIVCYVDRPLDPSAMQSFYNISLALIRVGLSASNISNVNILILGQSMLLQTDGALQINIRVQGKSTAFSSERGLAAICYDFFQDNNTSDTLVGMLQATSNLAFYDVIAIQLLNDTAESLFHESPPIPVDIVEVNGVDESSPSTIIHWYLWLGVFMCICATSLVLFLSLFFMYRNRTSEGLAIRETVSESHASIPVVDTWTDIMSNLGSVSGVCAASSDNDEVLSVASVPGCSVACGVGATQFVLKMQGKDKGLENA